MKNKLIFDLEFIYTLCFGFCIAFFMLGFGGILIPSIESLIMYSEFTILPYAIGSLFLSGYLFISFLVLFGITNILEYYEKHKKKVELR